VKRVLVIAQSAVVRAGLVALVEGGPGLELAGNSARVAPGEFARQVAESEADVVLVELGDDGAFDDLLALLEEDAFAVVVAIGGAPDGSRLTEALRVGVRAMLPREASADEVLAAIEAAAAGLVALEHAAVESLLNGAAEPRRASRPEDQTDALTPREVEVLGLLAEGAGNKQIAFRLGISEHTVKFHVASIFSKLGASSRTEAVTLGVRRGLVML
jgi:NarL family two-component system response regulator YdfI